MPRYEAKKRGQVDVYEVRKKKVDFSNIVAYVGGTILVLILIFAGV